MSAPASAAGAAVSWWRSRAAPPIMRDAATTHTSRRCTLEGEPNLYLHVAQWLRARGGAKPGGPRRQPRGIERTIREVLRVDDGQIGRAPVDHVPVAIVDDHRVEQVEHLEPELETAIAAEPELL